MVNSVCKCALLLPLILVSACSHADKSAPSAPAARITAITWNIHGCRGGLDEVAAELRARDADLILLQEAEVNPPGASSSHQPRLLAERLGMNYYSAGSALETGGEQHMAILARSTLRNPVALDAGTGRVYGVAVEVTIAKRTLHVVCVHLTSSYKVNVEFVLRTSKDRTREVADLAQRVKQWGGDVLIGGDFNMPPDAAGFEPLAVGAKCIATRAPTFPAGAPVMVLDYFFSDLRPAGEPTVAQSTRSDHLPVQCVWTPD